MKNLIPALYLMGLLIAATSCKKDVIGEGPVTTETRTVTNFGGIDLRMNGNVYYTNSSNWKVEVSAKESILRSIETKVENNRLVIRYNNGRTYDADPTLRINVCGPGLNSFELSSSGSIFCMNAIQSTGLFAKTRGSGSINLQHVFTNSIQAESLVSGRITATGGTVTSAVLRTDGSGKIDLSAISANDVTARTVGSGDIKVRVSDRLDATIDGSGDVYFTGNPLITSHVNGSGRIIRF